MARVAKYPWYFETDKAREALAGRRLLEQYLADYCDGDLFAASIVYGELLSNVIKHAPEGGVRVWLERKDDRVELCINDSGSGFTRRDLDRAPDADAESGRGLYIIKRISGRLWFRRSKRGFFVRALLPITCARH